MPHNCVSSAKVRPIAVFFPLTVQWVNVASYGGKGCVVCTTTLTGVTVLGFSGGKTLLSHQKLQGEGFLFHMFRIKHPTEWFL